MRDDQDIAMLTIRYVLRWERAAMAGRVNALGSAEYRRSIIAWIEGGSPADVDAYIPVMARPPRGGDA
jgi:hypothetical protein